MDEVTDLNEKVLQDLNTHLSVPKDVLASFQIKDQLNPDIWENEKLKPEIKSNLVKIGKDFFKTLELPANIKLKDILFVGSLANYNWSKFSDIDLHLVVDFSEFKEDEDFIKSFFDAQKNLFNSKHDIEVKGYPVEVYVQDVAEKLHAGAIYSVPRDKWVLKPDATKLKIDKKLIKRKVQRIFDKLKSIKKDYELKAFQTVIDKTEALKADIKEMRQSGLEKGGEYSIENLVFKVLRRTDFMELLDSYKIKSYDQLVSVNEDLP
jgi:predicted nucleotidyltransferase